LVSFSHTFGGFPHTGAAVRYYMPTIFVLSSAWALSLSIINCSIRHMLKKQQKYEQKASDSLCDKI